MSLQLHTRVSISVSCSFPRWHRIVFWLYGFVNSDFEDENGTWISLARSVDWSLRLHWHDWAEASRKNIPAWSPCFDWVWPSSSIRNNYDSSWHMFGHFQGTVYQPVEVKKFNLPRFWVLSKPRWSCLRRDDSSLAWRIIWWCCVQPANLEAVYRYLSGTDLRRLRYYPRLPSAPCSASWLIAVFHDLRNVKYRLDTVYRFCKVKLGGAELCINVSSHTKLT